MHQDDLTGYYSSYIMHYKLNSKATECEGPHFYLATADGDTYHRGLQVRRGKEKFCESNRLTSSYHGDESVKLFGATQSK
jgi:hypothetical protein